MFHAAWDQDKLLLAAILFLSHPHAIEHLIASYPQTHKMAWPFLEPVDPSDAPDYYRVIKEPMGEQQLAKDTPSCFVLVFHAVQRCHLNNQPMSGQKWLCTGSCCARFFL